MNTGAEVGWLPERALNWARGPGGEPEKLATGRGQSPGWGRRDGEIVGSAVWGGQVGPRPGESALVYSGRELALDV